jgi:hypothetical protein
VAIILEKMVAAPEVGLQPWFVKRAAELSRAVGRVSLAGRGFGTGFLIAPRIVLTCYHVLPDAEAAKGSSLERSISRPSAWNVSWRIVR